jgi:hypothetical protein
VVRSNPPAFVRDHPVRAAFGRRAFVWLVGCSLAAAGGGAATARALEPDGPALIWNAPAHCPDAPNVQARVRAQISERGLSDRPWQAHAEVRHHAGRYQLELTLYSSGGEARRQLDAVSCEALADAVGVLISLALADAAEAEPSPPPSAAAPAAAAAAATDASAAPAQRSTAASAAVPRPSEVEAQAAGGLPAGPETAWPFRYGLAVSLRLDLGMLPQRPAFGLGPRVLLQLGPLQAVAGLTWWLVASSQPDNYPSARLEGSGLLGDLVLGFELLATPLRLAPCLVFEHGQLQVSSTDVAKPDDVRFSWTAAGGGVRAGIALVAGFQAGLELLALAPWSRQRLLLQTPGVDVPLFVSDALALRISVELAYVFE